MAFQLIHRGIPLYQDESRGGRRVPTISGDVAELGDGQLMAHLVCPNPER